MVGKALIFNDSKDWSKKYDQAIGNLLAGH
jgi:hypothetical protein